MSKYNSHFIGFDQLFDSIFNETFKKPTYPPYNIIKNDNNYVIEMAVAGFKSEDIDISHKDDNLIIKSSLSENPDPSSYYLYQGIANRHFNVSFKLDKFVEIKGAELSDGILKINLEKIVPEEMKPRKINIEHKQ